MIENVMAEVDEMIERSYNVLVYAPDYIVMGILVYAHFELQMRGMLPLEYQEFHSHSSYRGIPIVIVSNNATLELGFNEWSRADRMGRERSKMIKERMPWVDWGFVVKKLSDMPDESSESEDDPDH